MPRKLSTSGGAAGAERCVSIGNIAGLRLVCAGTAVMRREVGLVIGFGPAPCHGVASDGSAPGALPSGWAAVGQVLNRSHPELPR